MSVCLRHVETIVRDRFFFMHFAVVCSEEGRVKDKLTQYFIPLFIANTMVKRLALYLDPLVSYNHLYKRL